MTCKAILTACLFFLPALAMAQPAAEKPATESIEGKYLKNITQVTSGFVKAGEGYFSPNGKQIIFSAKIKKVPKLYYISSFGGRTVRVTKSPLKISETNPVWSK